MEIENRSSQRFECSNPAVMHTEGGAALSVYMANLSAGGAQLMLRAEDGGGDAPAEGDRVTLSFRLPQMFDEDPPLVSQARVVHVHSETEGWLIGLEFIEMPDETKARLEEFIQTCLRYLGMEF